MMALTLVVWFLHFFDNERFMWNVQFGEWFHCVCVCVSTHTHTHTHRTGLLTLKYLFSRMEQKHQT